jgi:predicted FMN-binding regulatory protein PaiB
MDLSKRRSPSCSTVQFTINLTPKFYVETKPDTGKVVPTWNYSAVQVYGKATILFDS